MENDEQDLFIAKSEYNEIVIDLKEVGRIVNEKISLELKSKPYNLDNEIIEILTKIDEEYILEEVGEIMILKTKIINLKSLEEVYQTFTESRKKIKKIIEKNTNIELGKNKEETIAEMIVKRIFASMKERILDYEN